tara:strand:- start:729 stop:1058 length:330 start_codon:yes stop_codon:yes gene_type:complete
MRGSRQAKTRPAIEIELTYDEVGLIPDLLEEESFKDHILTETYDSISYAVENSLDKIDLFNIVNLGYNISLGKENFIPTLNVILKMYERKEDYLECATVQNLIKFINHE